MVAKSHCKVHFGDGDDEEEVELEDFYDYSSRLVQLLLIYVEFLIIYKHVQIKFSFIKNQLSHQEA